MKNTILSAEAKQFLSELHKKFNGRRKELLQQRKERQAAFDKGIRPQFLKETEAIRNDPNWKVAVVPADLQRRWVEITGPTDRKMMINALNSGADVFMADFEDANAPTWNNMLEGQANLADAVNKTLAYTNPEGKEYRLNPHTATLMVRPRGLHLVEKHYSVEEEFISGSFFDFGLSFFHNAKRLVAQGSGPYYYLPKLESYHEAELWNQVFIFAQEWLNIPRGTVRATVLIETIPAAFEMEEILYALKEHSAGLNAGRWDYLFSIIKKFAADPALLFPDRSELTMGLPFMRAYAELLVHTCHKRGAQAIGGMSAFIPSRKDPAINAAALQKVREDKLRECAQGFEGAWVAHPDLVPIVHQLFEELTLRKGLEEGNQTVPVWKPGRDGLATFKELLQFGIPSGVITEAGFRHNIAVALLYLTSWLSGTGAAALFNLMEDAATAEICRAQLWQWLHRPAAAFNDGRKITPALYDKIVGEECAKIEKTLSTRSAPKMAQARQLLDQLVLADTFVEFLTLPAYEILNDVQ
jgi:malate synthase